MAFAALLIKGWNLAATNLNAATMITYSVAVFLSSRNDNKVKTNIGQYELPGTK